VRYDIENGKASRAREAFMPNPKLKLLEQGSEVMRFKHYSLRTERTYQEWIRRYVLFHGKRHPREMGAEVYLVSDQPGGARLQDINLVNAGACASAAQVAFGSAITAAGILD